MRETIIDHPRSRPSILPAGWSLFRVAADGGHWRSVGGLSVITSVARELDGRLWLHVSASRPSRLPSYADMVEVKELFIGSDAYAVSVLPPRAMHVNIHPHCLHLFHCLDGHPLPEFSLGGVTL